MSDQAHPVPDHRNILMSVSINRFTAMSRHGTCLVCHIDEDFCVVPREAMDGVDLILARKDGVDQGRKLMRGELVPDQTPTG